MSAIFQGLHGSKSFWNTFCHCRECGAYIKTLQWCRYFDALHLQRDQRGKTSISHLTARLGIPPPPPPPPVIQANKAKVSRLASMAKLANTFIAFVHGMGQPRRKVTDHRESNPTTFTKTQVLAHRLGFYANNKQTHARIYTYWYTHVLEYMPISALSFINIESKTTDFLTLAGLNYFLDWSYPHYQNQYRPTMRFWSCAILMQIRDRDGSVCDFFSVSAKASLSFPFLLLLSLSFPFPLSFRSFTHA